MICCGYSIEVPHEALLMSTHNISLYQVIRQRTLLPRAISDHSLYCLPLRCVFAHIGAEDFSNFSFKLQSNFSERNTDSLFTMAGTNLFLSPWEILSIAQENKYLRKV